MNIQKENSGRSMIEMLGVLAIIAVLTVGGIAGYGQAMDKFKINKAIDDYNMLLFGMFEHYDSLYKTSTKNVTGLWNVADSLGLVPSYWTSQSNTYNSNYGNMMSDSYGNLLEFFWVPSGKINASQGSEGRIVFSVYIGGYANRKSVGFSEKFCQALLTNTVVPLHDSLKWINFENNNSSTYYGSAYCQASNRKCISSMTVSEVNSLCSYCTGNNLCLLYMNF